MKLIFDFDSTIITSETIELLTDICISNEDLPSIRSRVESITNKAMNGDLSFKDALKQRLEILSLKRDHIDQMKNKIKKYLSPSVNRHREFFKNNRKDIFVVSGGFTEIILEVSRDLELLDNQVFGNTLLFKGESVVGFDQTNPLCESGGKSTRVKSLNLKYPSTMIGDGFTDYEVKRDGQATYFAAYTENIHRKKVVELADFKVSSMDELLVIINKN
ncbi:MAG: hypothetical protein CBD58_04575 [bacterium TMED198]|nr:MAG: hypothetical protein CBD58_04575 [bacterium TMED198]|tara:strand:+ start:319 stop:972 length:654 start_codon:yes stop_codon:yes gene_type:complete